VSEILSRVFGDEPESRDIERLLDRFFGYNMSRYLFKAEEVDALRNQFGISDTPMASNE
jgi:hypothetical protein